LVPDSDNLLILPGQIPLKSRGKPCIFIHNKVVHRKDLTELFEFGKIVVAEYLDFKDL